MNNVVIHENWSLTVTRSIGIRRAMVRIRNRSFAGFLAVATAMMGSNAVLGQGVPPTANIRPATLTVAVGHRADFSVDLQGSAPFSFQWRFGTNNIPGALNAAYTIDSVQTNNAGTYSVIVTNAFGSTTSTAATLIVVPADRLDLWTAAISGTTNQLNAVTGGANSIVAVGNSGTVITSTNGIDWSTSNSGTTNNLNAIAYGNDRFVAVGDFGVIIASADGVQWDCLKTDTNNFLYGLAFGAGKFVAAGVLSSVLASTNGVQWTTQDSGFTNIITSITFGNGRFIALDSFSGSDFASTNGIDWMPGKEIPAGGEYLPYPTSMTFGDGNFLLFGLVDNFQMPAYWSSPDGIYWTDASLFRFADGLFFHPATASTFGSGNFVGVFSVFGSDEFFPDYPGKGSIFSGAAVDLVSGTSTHQPWLLRQQFSRRLLGLSCWHDRFFAVGEEGEVQVSGILPPTLTPIFDGIHETTVKLMGTPFQSYVLQASESVTNNWRPISTNITTLDGTAIFSDPTSGRESVRFYRVLSH